MELVRINGKFSELIITIWRIRIRFMNRLINRRASRWFGYHGILTHIQKKNEDGIYCNWIWFRIPYKKFNSNK